jgi:hypothetical protein
LTAFFGPTAVGTSLFRAIRNTMMPLFWFSWMNMIFSTREFSELMRTLSVKKFADVILSMPFIQIRTFRATNTLYFTMTGWAVFYIVWKWSIRAPIIAGKRKKRSANKVESKDKKIVEVESKEIEHLIELAYQSIITRLDDAFEQEQASKQPTHSSDK